GIRVFIKPNLLTDRTPAEAVTTHPEVVRAIIRVVKDAGATPLVGDSPSSATKISRVWEKTGMQSLCEEENVELINLEKAGSKKFEKNGMSFSISQPILDADLIINAPKLKSHVLTILTAAIKNMYGCIPGYQKAILHKDFPSPSEFGKLMSEVFNTVPPAINIIDAITGMEGDGPAAGKPRDLGFLAASDDALALDLTLCQILNIDTRAVPYLKLMMKKEAGNTSNIDIVGAKIEDVSPTNFIVPSTMRGRLIPGWLVKILGPYLWIRPEIQNECTGCRRCIEACPVTALSLGDQNKAVLARNLCIECCCCHETCPQNAISMQQSPFLSFLRKGKKL
ncbi:hypothetical protein BVX94_00245, partial [bacterium B17]